MSTPIPDIAALKRNLDFAIEQHATANARLKEARADDTNALNRLNAAQKAFDEGVAKVREQSHGESDWARTRNRYEKSAS